MKKKGQGISMNVIIIAAIALLVLVVVAAIFLVNMGKVNQETGANQCLSAGGSCVPNEDSCDTANSMRVDDSIPCPTPKVCCILDIN